MRLASLMRSGCRRFAGGGQWLALGDGEQLDSSHDDNKPLAFKVGESGDIIDGMREGEWRRFVVPPKLGYRGQRLPGIPPDANLVFFVELMELEDSP